MPMMRPAVFVVLLLATGAESAGAQPPSTQAPISATQKAKKSRDPKCPPQKTNAKDTRQTPGAAAPKVATTRTGTPATASAPKPAAASAPASAPGPGAAPVAPETPMPATVVSAPPSTVPTIANGSAPGAMNVPVPTLPEGSGGSGFAAEAAAGRSSGSAVPGECAADSEDATSEKMRKFAAQHPHVVNVMTRINTTQS